MARITFETIGSPQSIMIRTMSGPATNASLIPWRNNTLEFQVMDQSFSRAQEIFRSSVVAVGIFLNVLVFSVVGFSRQLRYPRHIFWAAISIFECLFLVEYALELAVVLDRDRKACQVLLLIYPVDYSLLLSCLLLAAIDRYVSIVRYEWYKANVTNRGVVLLIAVASAASFFVITSPFWSGYQSIYNCTVNLTHVNRVFVWDLLLGIACVALHFKIFIRTRALIRQYVPSARPTPITVRFVRTSNGPSNASSGIL
jgi:5-hydroxytryptamine receptor 1